MSLPSGNLLSTNNPLLLCCLADCTVLLLLAAAAPAAAHHQCTQAATLYTRLLQSISRANTVPWTAHEDVLLLRAVHSHGTQWADIEALGLVPGRAARQLKERFNTTLDPSVDHSPLSAEVGFILCFEFVQLPMCIMLVDSCRSSVS
jgi:hypothetical protein